MSVLYGLIVSLFLEIFGVFNFYNFKECCYKYLICRFFCILDLGLDKFLMELLG